MRKGTVFETPVCALTMRRQSSTSNAPREAMPADIRPMLCSLVKEPFDSPEYLFEVKWDGYRLMSYGQGRHIKLSSRGGHDYSSKYPGIVTALKAIDGDFVIDGEAIVMNSAGKPDFDALQKASGHTSGVFYYVFDILWLNGRTLMDLPLVERKEMLRALVGENQTVKYSEHFDGGRDLFDRARELQLEGIVAKRRASAYMPGKRGKDWLKIPVEHKQEFVIGGWIESEKRNTFRTLLFGSYEGGKLKWKGHAGGGYKEKEMPRILKRLKAIEIEESPFDAEVEYSEGTPHWVKPELVANIKFATTTKSGKIRKPAIFLGFREDKDAKQVVTEDAVAPPKRAVESHATEVHSPSVESNWPAVESESIRNGDVFKIGGKDVRLYNVDRQLWKGVTKATLIEYYNTVSKYILPHLSGRPLSLHLKPKGPHAPGLYIKDMEGRQPSWADVYTTDRKHKKAGKRDRIDYLVCNNLPTLLYLINLGCIDINPWTSTVRDPLHPDFIVLDLDPSDDDFTKAIQAAKATKDLLDAHGIQGFVKTSGKTGIHIFVPCMEIDFAGARTIAERMCEQVNERLPSITTNTVTVADRADKLYLDPSQNDYSDTVACAYSVRPYKSPLVSTPLEWSELTAQLDPEAFNIHTMPARLKTKGELFARILNRNTASKNASVLRNTFL
jgi:bifunctional non-homologous end joining protein LigD